MLKSERERGIWNHSKYCTKLLIRTNYMVLTCIQDLELAKVLIRPNGLFMEDFSKEGMLTEEKYGSIDRVFIVCEEDEVMKVDFQRLIIEDSPPKEVILIREAGHMVMLSKPSELCQRLLEVAGRYHRLY